MKNKVLIIVVILLFFFNVMVWVYQFVDGNLKYFIKKDVMMVMDVFYFIFYNLDMKLYVIFLDMKGRVVIWVQVIYWDMIMNVYKCMKVFKYCWLIEEVYQGGYE